jgi:MFS family permease
VNRLGAFTLPFLTVVMTSELHASVATAGVAMTVFGIATIPSRLVGGRLTDRFGTRLTIVIGLSGCAVAQIWLATAGSLVSALRAVALLGLMFEVYEPPSQALIADLIPPADRPAAYGLLGAALAVAAVGAGLLATLLTGAGLRWLFVADAVTCLACALLIGLLLPDAAGREEAARSHAWRDRRLLLMVAAGTVFAVVYLQLMTTLPLTLIARDLPVSGVGLILTTSAMTMVAAQPLTRRLKHLDHFILLTIGYAVLAAGLILTALAHTLAVLMVATVIWSAGDLLLLGRTQSVVAELAPEGARGRYLAAYGTSWGIAAAVGPVAGTQLLQRTGPTTFWLTCAAIALALAATQPLIRRTTVRSYSRLMVAADQPPTPPNA